MGASMAIANPAALRRSRDDFVHPPPASLWFIRSPAPWSRRSQLRTVMLEPLLEHHQHPDDSAVIAGMLADANAHQLVEQFRAHDPALSQVGQAAVHDILQGAVRPQPRAEGEPEAVLG